VQEDVTSNLPIDDELALSDLSRDLSGTTADEDAEWLASVERRPVTANEVKDLYVRFRHYYDLKKDAIVARRPMLVRAFAILLRKIAKNTANKERTLGLASDLEADLK